MAESYNPAPFDLKNDDEQILIFIAYLNILKKNIGTYPPGHSAIIKSEEVLSAITKKIFSYAPVITINAIKNNLLVNGKRHSIKNVHVRDFTFFISRLGIASLILRKGLDIKELEKFCQLALSIPASQHIYQHKNILYEINNFSHVRVREIDLAAVRFIDEEVIISDEHKAPITAWQKLMLYCLSPDFQDAWDSDLLKLINVYDQGSLVGFIQTFNVPENRLVDSYNMVLKDYFQEVSEKEDELQQKQKFFSSINDNFKDFSPEVKEQLLSASFEIINTSNSEEQIEEVLKSMPPGMVIEVLTQAVLSKNVISPVLIKILIMLYKAGGETSGLSDEQKVLSKTIWDSIEELFSREGYEKYLSEEYSVHLQQISMSGGSSKVQPVGFETKEYLKSLQNKSVTRHVTAALMFLMQGNLEEQIYCNYADNIAETIPEMLEAGEFKHLVIIHKHLQRHLQANKSPAARGAIKRALNVYYDQQFITNLSKAYQADRQGLRPEIDELIMITGRVNLPWLVEQYAEEANNRKMRQTFNLILRLEPQASEIAFKELDTGDDNQKIALLKLIRYCSGRIPEGQIPRLLNSRNIELRLETIKVLVKINDPAATPALWKMICNRDNKVAFKALKVVHDYKVRTLASRLISQVKVFYISKNAYARNKAIIILLASMGCDDLLPLLEKRVGAKLTITPFYLRQSQELFYCNLNSYSIMAVDNLLQRGLKSKNKNVAAICKRVIGKKVGRDDKIDRSLAGDMQFRGV